MDNFSEYFTKFTILIFFENTITLIFRAVFKNRKLDPKRHEIWNVINKVQVIELVV